MAFTKQEREILDLRKTPPKETWVAPPLVHAEIMAIKALHAGTANAYQQQVALAVIMNLFAGASDSAFRPGGEDGKRATDFMLGRQFVAKRIEHTINRPVPVTVTEGEANARTDKPESQPGAGEPAGQSAAGEQSSAGEPAAPEGRRNPKPRTGRRKPTSEA